MINKLSSIHRPRKLFELSKYMQDEGHPNHQDVIIRPRLRWGIPERMGDEAFLYQVIRDVERQNAKIRRGRDISRLAIHAMVRTPPVREEEAILTSAEEVLVPRRVHEELGGQLIAQGHAHPAGDIDWHLLLVAKWPKEGSPRVTFTALLDQIHEEMNHERLAKGRPLLPRVVDVRAARLAQRGFPPLAIRLAEEGPLQACDLERRLRALGHELGPGGVDPAGDRVHVVHRLGGRSYPYHLAKLIEEVARACQAGESILSGQEMEPSEKYDEGMEMGI